MAEPVRISIVADAGQATSELRQVVQAAADTEERLDAAGRASSAWAGKADFAGGAAAKMAGGLGDVADGLAKNGIISEEAAEKADQVAKGMMVVAGAADIATTASAIYASAQTAGGVAAARAAIASRAHAAATVIQSGVTKAAAAAQWLMNAAMAANPLGLIVLAVVALVAAIVLLWRNSETFRRIVTGAWQAIKTAAVAVFDFLKGYFLFIWDAYKKVFSVAIDAIRSYFGFIFGLPERLKNIGQDLMRGLVDGIQAGLKWVRDKVIGLGQLIPNWLKSVLGISSPSTVMAGLGRDVMRGLNHGMASQVSAIEGTLGTVNDAITGIAAAPAVDIGVRAPGGGAAAGPGSGAGAATYNLTVNVAPGTDAAETGRQIVLAIQAYERRAARRLLVAAL